MAFGSLAALGEMVTRGELLAIHERHRRRDTLPTAAAFIGATEAAIELSMLFEASGARVEALMHLDRSSSDEAVLRVSEHARRTSSS